MRNKYELKKIVNLLVPGLKGKQLPAKNYFR